MAIGPNQLLSTSNGLQLTFGTLLSVNDKGDEKGKRLLTRQERRESESTRWVIRKMPRSWRLEIRTEIFSPSNSDLESVLGIRSTKKALKIHCALLRQIFGLSNGHFSMLTLPTSLVRGNCPLVGSFHDRDLNPELAGISSIEKRLYNFALMETTRRYLNGEENWLAIECPESNIHRADCWSLNVWERDSELLREAFDLDILPLRRKDVPLLVEAGA
jgi:hypothetical protein